MPQERDGVIPATRRSPYLRARIIEELGRLHEDERLSASEIASKIGSKGGKVARHLQNLRIADLVYYNPTNMEHKGEFFYTLVSERTLPDRVKAKNITASDIATLFLSYAKVRLIEDPNCSFDVYTVSNELYPIHCQLRTSQGKERVRRDTFEKNVSAILVALKKNGVFLSRFIIREHQAEA